MLLLSEIPYLYHEIPVSSIIKREEFAKKYSDRFSQKEFRKRCSKRHLKAPCVTHYVPDRSAVAITFPMILFWCRFDSSTLPY